MTKRVINLFLPIIFILFSVFILNYYKASAQEALDKNTGCFDSDNGKDYYTLGETNDFLTTTPVKDYCTQNGKEVDECIPSEGDENCGITEKYCTSFERISGGYLSGDDFLKICPLGCKNGACIIPEDPGENTCFDSEETKDYNNAGQIFALGEVAMEEYCKSDQLLMEFYCKENKAYSTLYNCPNGCFDGACIEIDQYQKTNSQCNETDNGNDIYNYGYVYDTGTRSSDECFGNKLLEYYCERGVKKHQEINCENGCQDGYCIAKEGVEIFEPIKINNQKYKERVRGKILLKTEDDGQSFYVSPANNTAYYLGRPENAFTIMREQSIGISNKDLSKIAIGLNNLSGEDSDGDGLPDLFEDAIGTDKKSGDSDGDGYSDKTELINSYSPVGTDQLVIDDSFAKKHRGEIFLQVENKGAAWYVNPDDNRRYFLGRPADAFQIMRKLGLGISNIDFNNLN